MSQLSQVFVSVVAPLDRQAGELGAFVRELCALLEERYAHYEVLLVDDGSEDGTQAAAAALLESQRHLRYLCLTRRFGLEAAMVAGLENAIGNVVVCAAPGDPLERIPGMVERAASTGVVQLGQWGPAAPGRGLRGAARRLFCALSQGLLGLKLEPRSTHFMALPRRAVTALMQVKDKFRYLQAFHGVTGFRYELFDYTPRAVQGRPFRRSWAELFALAADLVVANSTRPLRFAAALGLLASTANLAYVGYVAAVAVFKAHVAEGWITLSLQLACSMWALALLLAVVAEYLARLVLESKDRPLYFLEKEELSNAPAAAGLNVVQDGRA